MAQLKPESIAEVESVEPEPLLVVEPLEPEPIVAAEPFEPEPIAEVEPIDPEPLEAIDPIEPVTASAVREPYEYAVIDHDSEPLAVADIDEINPAKPDDHEIITGGALAQTRIVTPTETEVETLVPVEDEAIVAAPV